MRTRTKELYVKSEDNLVYKLDEFETVYDRDYIILHLYLECGWDYINPDENNIQGYVPRDRFVDAVQLETLVCYIFDESIKECLISNGFEILKGNPMEKENE